MWDCVLLLIRVYFNHCLKAVRNGFLLLNCWQFEIVNCSRNVRQPSPTDGVEVLSFFSAFLPFFFCVSYKNNYDVLRQTRNIHWKCKKAFAWLVLSLPLSHRFTSLFDSFGCAAYDDSKNACSKIHIIIVNHKSLGPIVR